jgi:hypothetical protein
MDKNRLLSRLLKGYYFVKVKDFKLKVKPPTVYIENKAELYHNKIIEDLKFDDSQDWLDEDKRMFILSINKIWHNDLQKELDVLLLDMGVLKTELFKNFNLIDTRKLIKEKIKETESRISILHNKRYTYFDHTKQSYANVLKNHYIIKNTVYLKDKLFFKTHKEQHLYYLQRLSNLITELNIQDIRSITHDDSWKSLWESAKTSVFDKPIKDCNIEQRMVIGASMMLDNIRQHPECPSEEILQDSDALDGWVLFQNDKFEKQQKQKAVENNIKDKNAGEIFVMAKSAAEIKSVMELNDPLTQTQIRKTIEHAENTKGETKWQDIPGMKDVIVREKTRE